MGEQTQPTGTAQAQSIAKKQRHNAPLPWSAEEEDAATHAAVEEEQRIKLQAELDEKARKSREEDYARERARVAKREMMEQQAAGAEVVADEEEEEEEEELWLLSAQTRRLQTLWALPLTNTKKRGPARRTTCQTAKPLLPPLWRRRRTGRM
mmetsp:Transcript_34037/g.67059  ORF Transcript_34037/g.67059 Transcript_34037/m.67059 type:complete len:152 (+) Transcript_34037:425-880(+)